MEGLGNVQSKIACLFDTVTVDSPSTKRQHQQYKVVAGDTLRESAITAGIENARPTEKVDGTCSYVEIYCEKPWLWARHDRKPNKAADKRFKKYQSDKRRLKGKEAGTSDGDSCVPEKFHWDVEKDFKEVPADWVPASEVPDIDGVPQPDESGHIVGWVPVDPAGRQHCWHASTVDFDNGLALILRPGCSEPSKNLAGETTTGKEAANLECLEIVTIPLKELIGSTVEVLGTKINGNPYKIGSKARPIHFLVRHGSIPIKDRVPLNREKVLDWFHGDAEHHGYAEGQVEGVVWHCPGGKLFKVHRHHLGLPWPINELRLLRMPVSVNVRHDLDTDNSLFVYLSQLNGKTFPSIMSIASVGKD